MTILDVDVEEDILWSTGWAFFICEEKPKKNLPPLNGCTEWIKGFCAAMANYAAEPYQEYQSIQEALSRQGIKAELLEACLISAETILSGDEWERVPDVPIRETC